MMYTFFLRHCQNDDSVLQLPCQSLCKHIYDVCPEVVAFSANQQCTTKSDCFDFRPFNKKAMIISLSVILPVVAVVGVVSVTLLSCFWYRMKKPHHIQLQ
jgi:hypothetical protein